MVSSSNLFMHSCHLGCKDFSKGQKLPIFIVFDLRLLRRNEFFAKEPYYYQFQQGLGSSALVKVRTQTGSVVKCNHTQTRKKIIIHLVADIMTND